MTPAAKRKLAATPERQSKSTSSAEPPPAVKPELQSTVLPLNRDFRGLHYTDPWRHRSTCIFDSRMVKALTT